MRTNADTKGDVMDFICATCGPQVADFKDMSRHEQRSILRDAYNYKRFLECPEHAWVLDIDCGAASIDCIKCMASFEEVSTPDYREEIFASIPLSFAKYSASQDYWGEWDSNLEFEIRA